MFLMTWFEQWTPGIGSNLCANWATTAAQNDQFLCWRLRVVFRKSSLFVWLAGLIACSLDKAEVEWHLIRLLEAKTKMKVETAGWQCDRLMDNDCTYLLLNSWRILCSKGFLYIKIYGSRCHNQISENLRA